MPEEEAGMTSRRVVRGWGLIDSHGNLLSGLWLVKRNAEAQKVKDYGLKVVPVELREVKRRVKKR